MQTLVVNPLSFGEIFERQSLPQIQFENPNYQIESTSRPVLPPLKDLLRQMDVKTTIPLQWHMQGGKNELVQSDSLFRFIDSLSISSHHRGCSPITENIQFFPNTTVEQRVIQSPSLVPDATLCAALEEISQRKTSTPPMAATEIVPSHCEQTYKCSWDFCDSTPFSTRTGLATHVSSHLVHYVDQVTRTNSRGYPCRWSSCNLHFDSIKQLAKHLSDSAHVGQTPFIPKETADLDVVKSRRKLYFCSIPGCGRRFTDSSNRKKHERTHDTNRQRFHCPEDGCGKSYSTKTDLKIHMKVHRGEFTHRCTYPSCNKAFIRLSELYAHERTHDNALPHRCQVCGKQFREKVRFVKHEASHIYHPLSSTDSD